MKAIIFWIIIGLSWGANGIVRLQSEETAIGFVCLSTGIVCFMGVSILFAIQEKRP